MIDLNKNHVPKKVIVMIPAYNEEKTISKVIKNIPREILGVSEVKVLVLDDFSSDSTYKISDEAGADYISRNKSNLGLGRNFKKGIEYALKLGADIIVNIDGDGQFDSGDIPKLIQPIIDEKADMVTCSRFLSPELTKNMPWLKVVGNRMFTNTINLITRGKFTDTQCGFRAYSRESALKLNLQGKFTYTHEVFIDLIEKGFRIKEVALPVVYSKERKSKISGSLIKYGLKSLGIIAKTLRNFQPLTFFGLPATAIFSLGFIGALYTFIYWLFFHVTSPVRTLFNVSIFFMIFGVSLIVLALVADMLKSLKHTQDEIFYMIKKREFNGFGLIAQK